MEDLTTILIWVGGISTGIALFTLLPKPARDAIELCIMTILMLPALIVLVPIAAGTFIAAFISTRIRRYRHGN